MQAMDHLLPKISPEHKKVMYKRLIDTYNNEKRPSWPDIQTKTIIVARDGERMQISGLVDFSTWTINDIACVSVEAKVNNDIIGPTLSFVVISSPEPKWWVTAVAAIRAAPGYAWQTLTGASSENPERDENRRILRQKFPTSLER